MRIMNTMMTRKIALSAVTFIILNSTSLSIHAFSPFYHLKPTTRNTHHHASSTADEGSSSSSGGGGGGGITLFGDKNFDASSILKQAFTGLSEVDQYDAVLTGLCAKILDGGGTGEGGKKLDDPLKLLKEMNDRRVKASGRSLMALVDAAVTTEDPRIMSHVLSLSLSNGSLSQYGSLQSTILTLPTTTNQKIKCPDGKFKTRSERLESIKDVPTDDRASEVMSAVVVSGLVSSCFVLNALGMDDMTPLLNWVVFLIVGVGVVDNFYDAIGLAGNLVVKTNQDKLPEGMKDTTLPDKDDLPLGLGTGKITGTVVRGLSRLVTKDTERECECEAAAFYAAYSLGLPCFAFRPNSLEAAILIFESMKNDEQPDDIKLDPLLSSVGILKVLIWLMAPVVMESSKHAQLIASDPREGSGLLRRLQEKASVMGMTNDDLRDALSILPSSSLKGSNDEEEENKKSIGMDKEGGDLLKWAYAEADSLLRNNREIVTELTERLAGGAATVGDCVAMVEGW